MRAPGRNERAGGGDNSLCRQQSARINTFLGVRRMSEEKPKVGGVLSSSESRICFIRYAPRMPVVS